MNCVAVAMAERPDSFRVWFPRTILAKGRETRDVSTEATRCGMLRRGAGLEERGSHLGVEDVSARIGNQEKERIEIKTNQKITGSDILLSTTSRCDVPSSYLHSTPPSRKWSSPTNWGGSLP
jgi:hypothetical protein